MTQASDTQKPLAAQQRARLVERLAKGVRDGGSVPMRGSRAMRTTLRSLHLIAIAALYGGHVFDVDSERLLPALLAVIASGAAFMLFEVLRAPIWLVQLRGVGTYVKLVLVGSVAVFWDHRVAILSLVIVLGTVLSHMPSQYRYYSLLHRRVVKGGESG